MWQACVQRKERLAEVVMILLCRCSVFAGMLHDTPRLGLFVVEAFVSLCYDLGFVDLLAEAVGLCPCH